MEDLQPSELPGRTESYTSAFILPRLEGNQCSPRATPTTEGSGGGKKRDSPTNKRIPYTYRQVYPHRFIPVFLETALKHPKSLSDPHRPCKLPSGTQQSSFGLPALPFAAAYTPLPLRGNRSGLNLSQGGFNCSIPGGFPVRVTGGKAGTCPPQFQPRPSSPTGAIWEAGGSKPRWLIRGQRQARTQCISKFRSPLPCWLQRLHQHHWEMAEWPPT